MIFSVTLLIIVVTCIVSYIGFTDVSFFNRYSHQPYMETRFKQYDRLLTSGFLHGDYVHLGLNMFVFWQFGKLIEGEFTDHFGLVMGEVLFLLMYLSAIVISDLPTLRRYKDSSVYTSIGASGAVAAILFAFIVFNPWAMLGIFGIIPVPAVIAGVLYLVYEQWAGKNRNDNIGHDAHLMGAFYGMLFIFVVWPQSLPEFVHMVIHECPFLK